MTMVKMMSGEMLSTDDLIKAFEELGQRKILSEQDVEAVEVAHQIKNMLCQLRDIEEDPTVNPFLVMNAREILGDAINAYITGYVYTPDPFH